MTEGELDFEDRIIVLDTAQMRDVGIAGETGRIVGKSYQDDVVGNPAVAYVVALDDDPLTHFVELNEVESDPSFAKPSY